MPRHRTSDVYRRLAGITLLSVAAIMAFYAIRYEHTQRVRVAEDARAQAKLFSIEDANLIHRIVLQGPGASTFELERQGTGETAWMLVQPRAVVAEASTIDALLHQWLDLRQIGQVPLNPEHPVDKQRFGLSPPAYTLRLEQAAQNGHMPVIQTLLFGKTNGFDGSVYVQREDQTAIWRVGQQILPHLQQDLYKLRDKRLAIFAANDIVDIEVKPHPLGPGFKLHQVDTQHVELQKPLRAPASIHAFEDLCSALATLHAKSFVAETSPPNKRHLFGLRQPRFDVELTLKDGAHYHVHVGEIQIRGQTHGFARLVDDDAPILELGSDWLLQQLREPVRHFRDLRVVPVALAAIAKLHVQHGTEKVTLVRTHISNTDDIVWHNAADPNAPLQQGRILAFLNQLTSLQATKVVDEKPTAHSLQQHHFHHPQFEVELYDGHDTLLRSVAFAVAQDGQSVFATTDAKTRIDMIAPAQQQELENLWQHVTMDPNATPTTTTVTPH